MSAFDIAGAVVWTPLAVLMWYVLFTSDGNLTAVGDFDHLVARCRLLHRPPFRCKPVTLWRDHL